MGNGASVPASDPGSGNTGHVDIRIPPDPDKHNPKRRKSNDFSSRTSQQNPETHKNSQAPSLAGKPHHPSTHAKSTMTTVEGVHEFPVEDVDDAGPDHDMMAHGLVSQRNAHSKQTLASIKGSHPHHSTSHPSPTHGTSSHASVKNPTPLLSITGSAKNPQQRDPTAPKNSLASHKSGLASNSRNKDNKTYSPYNNADDAEVRDQLMQMNAKMDSLIVQASDIASIRSNAKAHAKAAAAAKREARTLKQRNSHEHSHLPSNESSNHSTTDAHGHHHNPTSHPVGPQVTSQSSLSEKSSMPGEAVDSRAEVMDFLKQVEMKMRAKEIASAPPSTLTPDEFAYNLEQKKQEKAAQRQAEQARRLNELEALRIQHEGDSKRKEVELELLRQQIRNADAALHIEALKDEVKRVANAGTSPNANSGAVSPTNAGANVAANTRVAVKIKGKPANTGVATGSAIIGTGNDTKKETIPTSTTIPLDIHGGDALDVLTAQHKATSPVASPHHPATSPYASGLSSHRRSHGPGNSMGSLRNSGTGLGVTGSGLGSIRGRSTLAQGASNTLANGTGNDMGMYSMKTNAKSPQDGMNYGGPSGLASMRTKTQRGVYNTGPLPQVAELAVLEQALKQDIADDKALDAQLQETAARVAALERAAAEKRARKALKAKNEFPVD